MIRVESLSLRLRVFLFFAALALGNLAAIGAGLCFGSSRLDDPQALSALLTGAIVAAFVVTGLIAGVWFLFDQNVARPIERLAGNIRARTMAQIDGDLDHSTARYLGDLGGAAAAVTAHLAETRSALAESVARETTRLAAEKDRLEHLLGDVPVGVLLCSPDHQLVFYNGHAVDLLGGADAAALPGLDRGLFDYLHDAPVREAYARLLATEDHDAASDLLCTTVAGGRILAARMRLIADKGAHPGYVLTLRDVTGDLATHAAQEALIEEFFERVRRPAANLQGVIGAALDDAALPAPVATALRQETARLSGAVTDLAARHDAGRAEWWPLSPIRARDLAAAARARAGQGGGVTLVTQTDDLLLRCDGFQIGALMAALARHLAQSGLTRQDFAIRADGAGALLTLDWPGPALPLARLEGWLDLPIDPALPDVTGRSVLRAHATEIWPEPTAEGGRICLPLREARRATARPAPVSRKVVYDFDLLARIRHPEIENARLADLVYVVFDSETTGLFPETDEICQLAAVRIVNGRRIETEVFDMLVNPGRPIPPGSTAVHGITDAMVADAPDVNSAVRRFHKFAQNAVLVAHNAPFDMTFLKRREAAIGAAFDHPILDTVLLSAVLFGQSEVHSLDALTHRLGITIPEEARHTAIGDTIATADAFLKLLPALRSRGIETFGQLLAEVRQHGRLLKDLNG
ncbi:exonuclease domain-containing protein [Paracoccus sp. p4-l81]|uniref:3'-5' exonuclease n=1 Tax=Paracoccus sp. p4-l81 TaxID=3342806 RepID=UPI0035BB4DDE